MSKGRRQEKGAPPRGLLSRLAFVVVLATLPLWAGCVKKTYNLNHIRVQLEALNKELSEAYYNNHSYGKELEISHIYEKYLYLIEDETVISYVGDIRDRERNATEKTRLTYLYAELLDHYLGQRTSRMAEKIANIQAREIVVADGEEIAFRQIPLRLMNEQDRERRKRFYRAQAAVIEKKLNPLLMEELHLIEELSRELGYDNFAHMQEVARGDDFDRLEALADQFLVQTEKVFRELLREEVHRTLGLSLEEVRGWDRARLSRGQQFDEYFPKDRLLPLVRNTLSGLNLNLEEQDNIVIDAEGRAQKSPQAACFPISVPQDIRVVIKPVGGIRDYQALFYGMGRAQHFANIKTSEYEFRRLGDMAVTEASAFLLENLFMDETFLRDHLNIDGPDLHHLLRKVLFDKLCVMRLCCGKFLYQNQLHRGTPDPLASYGLLMERATLLSQTDEDNRRGYLFYGDDRFDTVDSIKAWFLEGQLRFRLREQFGQRWFERQEAGEYLKDIWALGSARPAESLAQHLGFGGLEPSFSMHELQELFRTTRTNADL